MCKMPLKLFKSQYVDTENIHGTLVEANGIHDDVKTWGLNGNCVHVWTALER